MSSIVYDKITLNVGGERFDTAIKTLQRHGGYLAEVSKTEGKEVFIDRDPSVFRYILNFLRDDRVMLPSDNLTTALLYQEAKFYELDELARAVAKFRHNADGYIDIKLSV